VSDVNIAFTACQGLDPSGNAQTNDLWAYMNKLYISGKLADNKLTGVSQNLVGSSPNSCWIAEKKFWYWSQGLVRGYTYNTSNWVQIAGVDAFNFSSSFGKYHFDLMLNASSHQIIHRVCGSCLDSHKHVYYKRLTPVPPALHVLSNIQFSSTIVPGQVYGQDFLLFSTYDDALDPTNAKAWPCRQANSTFPYGCGPLNQTYDDSQARLFYSWGVWGAQDVAFYIESGFSGATKIPGVDIGGASLPGYALQYNNKIYVASSAYGYGWKDTEFLMNQQSSSDVSIIVKVESMYFTPDRGGNWSKAGIQIRDSLDPNARYFALAVTGGNGIELSYRNSWTNSFGTTPGKAFSPVWLKVNLRMGTFTAYTSLDGATWSLFAAPVTLPDWGSNTTGVIQSGLVVTANDWAYQYADAVFSNYQNIQFSYPSSAPSISPAPSAIRTKMAVDINLQNSKLPGSEYFSSRSGVWKIKSGGSDVGGKSDSFSFVPFNVTNTTNFAVQAYIPTILAPSQGSKAGVMIRDSLNANATNAFAFLTGNYGLGLSWRPNPNVTSQSTGMNWQYVANSWVRLIKINNTITGWKKTTQPDAEWISLGAVNITFTSPTLYVGMAVASNFWNAYATATFQKFTINTTNPTLPSTVTGKI